MTTLYKVCSELAEIDSLLNESQGEISEQVEKRLAELAPVLAQKVDNVADYYFSGQQLLKNIDERIAHLESIRKTVKNKTERFEEYIRSSMLSMKKDELNGSVHSIKFRKPAKKIKITDENKIPVEFISTEVITKIKNAEIKKALERGDKIEGAELEDGKSSIIVS